MFHRRNTSYNTTLVLLVLQRVFFTFLNCANGTKSRNVSQQMQMKLVKVTIHSVHLPVSAARR